MPDVIRNIEWLVRRETEDAVKAMWGGSQTQDGEGPAVTSSQEAAAVATSVR